MNARGNIAIICPKCKSDDIRIVMRGSNYHKISCVKCDYGLEKNYSLSFPKALAQFDPEHPYLAKRKKIK
jgi:Zn ribbon nucleic-acid-binding protein